MVYCQDCGEEVSEDAAFCQECGTEIGARSGSESTATDDSSTDFEADADSDDGLDWRRAGVATLFAFFPAFGAYLGVSIAAYDTVGIVFLLSLPVFGYLLYQKRTKKAMASGMFFWLSIETFLTPFMLLIYTFAFAAQETATSAGQAGAAIGGFILVVVAFVVGVPVGIVLYLVSRRLDVDEQASRTNANAQAAD